MSPRELARAVKREAAAYRLMLAHPRTPRLARWLLAGALAYLFSPVDAVLDSIPFVGFFDDIVIIGGLAWLALRLLPEDVARECREKAREI